ncbi:OmpA family protein [Aestuariibacter halophilus]|uniref:OmpA family protein n=1 Tax=Fluctibacter halophilus TaxID=226011 RepID=A0ABS8GBT7_9ALTE|nr:OmpA family protein [Aestuariibacter halophilus]MCC2617696.1 OmpA family protein [Aestuariibacter halophilus]
MKRMTSLAIGTILGATIFPLQAQSADDAMPYQSWVGGFAEYYNADGDKPDPLGYLEDGHGIGAEFGFRFKPRWGVRLEWSELDIDTNAQRLGSRAPNNAGNRIGVDAMYFTPNDALYLFAGIKNETIGESHRLANLGLGKHWQVSERWRVITEAAVYHDFGEGFRDYGIKLGLAYTFGGDAPKAPKITTVDSDGDGVQDSLDACPNTPAGLAVDSRGCNDDHDGDGVSNAQDMCSNTPKGTAVGKRGCSLVLDSDQDGVLDDADQCPQTPITDKVDAVGCSVFVEQSVTQRLNVLFANNSSDIGNPDDPQFQAFATFMARFPNTSAVIEGHTSAPGNADYNQSLSERRANAVRDLLINQYGISAERLTAAGYGETSLLDDGNSAEAHAMNRRIEAVVSATQKVKVQK